MTLLRAALLSPRLNLIYALGPKTSLRTGWGRFYQTQGIHQLDVADGELTFHPAQLSEHRVVGLEHFFNNDVHLRLEAYDKELSSLRPSYRNWLDDIEIFPELQDDRVVSILEKPSEPRSNLAVTGCYFYDGRVFEIVRGLSPSDRGELEITDVNSRYVEWGALRHHLVGGWWTDAGTIKSLYHATQLVAAAEDAPVLRMPEVGASPIDP